MVLGPNGNGGFGGGGGGISGGGGGGYSGGGGSNMAGGGGGGSYISSLYCGTYVCAGVARYTGSYNGIVVITCYLPGTLVLTSKGERLVEDLNIGDLLPTLSGQVVPIKWIGKQKFNGKFATKGASPVRFHAGSLGDGLPKRDLFVSAGHSMKIGEYLVDARLLVNGVTITQHQTPEQLEYYHLDLGAHHCILAEGAWAETYLECNKNRDTFYNAGEYHERYPYHLIEAAPEKCLTHIADYKDPRHAALFKTLLAQIPQDRVTTDPDLHLLADGRRIEPYEFIPQAFMFRIPAGTKVLRLKSRTSSPCELGLPSDDRQLGFCIHSLSAESEDGTFKVMVEPHHTELSQGFHLAEGKQRRWTQGDALIPKVLMGGGAEDIILTVKGRSLARYHIGDEEVREEQLLAVASSR